MGEVERFQKKVQDLVAKLEQAKLEEAKEVNRQSQLASLWQERRAYMQIVRRGAPGSDTAEQDLIAVAREIARLS